jgi:3'(2'), 5'-bisphosphate nucleotidase
MMSRVTEVVNDALVNDAGHSPLSQEQVLRCIDRGCSSGGRTGRHWVLDPVDGTLGFVKGDQYAVALALVQDGVVVVAVLGCPNMPTAAGSVMESPERDGTLFYAFHTRLVSKMLAGAKGAGAWYKGVMFAAASGSGTWVQPVERDVPVLPAAVHVSVEATPSRMRITEPVLKANSSQSLTASIAATAGLGTKPLRLYSMVKYGAVARGDADVFMKFPKAGYKEKIWDHAAGVLVVTEAGGVVTDAGGQALDFGAGRFLDGLDRGIVAGSSTAHGRVMAAIQASWASSQL